MKWESYMLDCCGVVCLKFAEHLNQFHQNIDSFIQATPLQDILYFQQFKLARTGCECLDTNQQKPKQV